MNNIKGKAINDNTIILNQSYVGLNYPFFVENEFLSLETEKNYHHIVEADLLSLKEEGYHTLLALSDKISIENFYHKKTPRSMARVVIFSLLALTSSIGFIFSDYTVSENLTLARSYLLSNKYTPSFTHYWLNKDTKNYTKVADILAKPPKMGDKIALYGIKDLDVELKLDSGYYHIIENKIHINPTEKFTRPHIPEILTLFTQVDNHQFKSRKVFEILDKVLWGPNLDDYYAEHKLYYPNDKQKEIQVEKDILNYFKRIYAESPEYLSLGLNPFYVKFVIQMNDTVIITQPQKLLKLLDQGCIKDIPKPCEKLYETLASSFNSPPNLYLAGLYNRYNGKELPVTEFKKLLQQDSIMVMPMTIKAFIKNIKYWAERNIEMIQDNVRLDLNKGRGGIIFTGSKQYFASDYRGNLFVDDKLYNLFDKIEARQNLTLQVTGIVSSTSIEKGELTINLVRRDYIGERQAIALILGGVLALLVLLISLISYVVPTSYPRNKKVSGLLVE
ncbi:hypothetical protein [Phocoenobacter atlanticus]|uniref:hypothetical protein n=1 Tax=Phocoenobacter atlanticus TaxID=3416742 RepID=UPI00278BFA36|nr:hypothetical protein [Pasteurella atlantica]